MPGPIVFISRNRIAEGRRGEFELAYGRAVGLIETTKRKRRCSQPTLTIRAPRSGVVHAFRDAGAMTLHFEGSEERTQSASDLITLAGFEIYGQAPATAVAQLRREAATIHATVQVFDDPLGGFLRAPR